MVLTIPWLYTSSLQYSKSIHVFCLMPLVCGTLLQWPMKRYGFDCLKWSAGIFFLFLFFKLWWHAHYLKSTALNILSIWFNGLMYIYLVELSLPLVSQTLSSCKTEIIYMLNYKASFLPTLSPWQPPFYFPFINLIILGNSSCIHTAFVFSWLVYFSLHNAHWSNYIVASVRIPCLVEVQ